MITFSPKNKHFVAIQPVDFRKGIPGLAALCQHQLSLDPMTGHCFLFRNKRLSDTKVLQYDGQGFQLTLKKLSKGQFNGWPKRKEDVLSLTAAQAFALFYNGEPENVITGDIWHPIYD